MSTSSPRFLLAASLTLLCLLSGFSTPVPSQAAAARFGRIRSIYGRTHQLPDLLDPNLAVHEKGGY